MKLRGGTATIALAIVVALSVVGSQAIERSSARALATASRMLGVVEVAPRPDEIRALEVRRPSEAHAWQFVRRDGVWRIPQHFDAYADPGAVDGFLAALFASVGPAVGRWPEDGPRYGTDESRAIVVGFDVAGRELQIWIGAEAPGQRGEDCHVRRAADDQILMLASNPRRFVEGSGPEPPLLDLGVIPAAAFQGDVVALTWSGLEGLALRRVARRELPPERWMQGRGDRFEWVGTFDAGERVVPAGALVGRLVHLRADALVDAETPLGRRIVTWELECVGLEAPSGARVILDAEVDDRGGLVRNRNTGLVARVGVGVLEGLLTDLQALAETPPPPGN